MFIKLVLIAAILLSLASLALAAPRATRSITGVVTDKRGNPLPGAAVQIEDLRTLSVTSCITGADGSCRRSLLDGNTEWIIKARYRQYWSKPKTLSQFDDSKHLKVNLVIPID